MTRLARLAALIVAACVTLILGPVIASQPASDKHSAAPTPSTSRHVSPRTVERGITDQADANLDNADGPYYAPGVDVARVDCWYTSADRMTCAVELTDGRRVDGSVFVPPSGLWYLYAEDDHADTRA